MGDHVFICYSRKDKDFVIKLAKNLKSQGVHVWLDQWDIPHGANWNRTIEKALIDCASLLIVLSLASVESDAVQSEWLTALDDKKVIVPILYQRCRIPFRLKPIQYIDFTSRSSDDIAALNDVLVALGKREGIPLIPAEISVLKEKLSAPSSSAFNPKDARAQSKRGTALFKQGKYDEAPDACDEAIRLDPNDAMAWFNKGNALFKQGKYDEALDAYDEAIRLDPNDDKAWFNKDLALNKQKRYNQAIKTYDKAIALNPNDAKAWYKKGVALNKHSKYDEAITAYDEAIRLAPNFAAAWNNKGNALKALGRNMEANASFAKAKKLGHKS
jgi:tetratricopeptide (TPR) repeat protein